jgi:hypothetical protein
VVLRAAWNGFSEFTNELYIARARSLLPPRFDRSPAERANDPGLP